MEHEGPAGISETVGELTMKADLTVGLAKLKAEMVKSVSELILARSVVILGAVFAMPGFMP